MIQHTVAFSLKHPKGSPQELDFLKEGMKLAQIPTVRNFRCLRQVSRKNAFDFGFSMAFESDAAYQAYSNHPFHQTFVATRWIPEVREFLELDYVDYVSNPLG